jgi:flagellin
MSMQFTQDDSYSFKIGSTQITASVSGGDLSNVISAVNSNTSTTGVSARQENGLMILENVKGAAINVTAFTSTGTGEVNVANAAGQGASATLNDNGPITGGTTAAAGKAVATTMDLTMSAKDKVTFQISDGVTNAVVRLTEFDPADNTGIIAEITSALAAVGSNITVAAGADVTNTGNGTKDEKLILTNSKGGKIDITKFTSDGTGAMTATPKTGQGVGKILSDDGVTGSQASVSAISLATTEGANSAIGAIDRAFEQINAQRSELGAITNRLDHTINNLGNIVVNTEAAQSRIEDADFAATTGELTKAQIMSQAATAMLAQANASKQGVLSLLQG